MSHNNNHSVKQILLLLIAVLLGSLVIVKMLQSTNNLRYLWIGLGVVALGHMVKVKRGPVTTAMMGLVYVRAAMAVVYRGMVEGVLVIRRDWEVCLWRAKQLP